MIASESIQEIQGLYASDGASRPWADNEEHNHILLKEYIGLLVSEDILPKPENASGYVVYSPSSNQAFYEHEFARHLDNAISKLPKNSRKLNKPPLFIAADVFGERKLGFVDRILLKLGAQNRRGRFVPGFSRRRFTGKDLRYVKFGKISADAAHIPLLNDTVDVVWDRLGALWHAQDSRIYQTKDGERTMRFYDPGDDLVKRILGEYERVLKPGGCVVVDAYKLSAFLGTPNSTFDMLNIFSIRVNLRELGWDVSNFIGEGNSRLAVLKPIQKS